MKKTIFLSIAISLTIAFSNSGKATNGGSIPGGIVISNDTCKIIDSYLTKLAEEKNFSDGLLIVKDGKKIFSKGYPPILHESFRMVPEIK